MSRLFAMARSPHRDDPNGVLPYVMTIVETAKRPCSVWPDRSEIGNSPLQVCCLGAALSATRMIARLSDTGVADVRKDRCDAAEPRRDSGRQILRHADGRHPGSRSAAHDRPVLSDDAGWAFGR